MGKLVFLNIPGFNSYYSINPDRRLYLHKYTAGFVIIYY